MGEITLWERAEKPKKDRTGPGLGAYVRPWVTGAAMVPAGMVAHALWGDVGATTGLAAAAITAAGGATTWLTWRLVRARSWYTAVMSTGTAGGITVWVAAATVAGTGRPVLDALIVVGGALAGLSNAHTWQRGQGGPRAGGDSAWEKPLPSWEQVCEIVGIRGATMRVIKHTDTQLKGEILLPPGQTADDVQSHRDGLASAYDVAPGAVRIAGDPQRARRAMLTIVTKDVMGQLIPWPGLNPDLVGASIADAPLELGVYEDGEPYTDEVDNRHTLVCGMPGAGKSVHGKVKLVSIAARSDTFVCAIDLSKGEQTLGPVRGAIGWAAYTRAEARAMLAGLDAAVKARADHLAAQRLPGWTKGCGLTFLHVLLEEAADLVDFNRLVELLRAARSTGMHFELSLQRASWTNIDTDARANLGDGICFGVRDSADADFVLPDYVTDAGCDPARWRKTRPGAAFAAVEHADPERHTVPVKMYGPPSTEKAEENAVLTPAADSLGDQDAKLDSITRAAFGAAYADYLARHRSGAVRVAGIPHADDRQEHAEMTAATPAPRMSRAERVAQAVAAADVQDHDDEPAVAYATADPDPDIPGDLDDPMDMPPGGGFTLPPAPRSREGAEQARARLDAQLALWADQGVATFRAPELRAALADAQGVKRDRTWVIRELARLEAEGRIIHHDGGVYELVAGDRELALA